MLKTRHFRIIYIAAIIVLLIRPVNLLTIEGWVLIGTFSTFEPQYRTLVILARLCQEEKKFLPHTIF